jgi:Mg2+ and Co2+ transporter CorA
MTVPEGSEAPIARSSRSSRESDSEPRPERHVQYALTINTDADLAAVSATHNNDDAAAAPGETTDENLYSPKMLRRLRTNARAATFKPVSDYEEFDTTRPGWQPGQEPGFDPLRSDAGHSSMPTLAAPAEVTIVDFSQDRIQMGRFDNEGFVASLKEPQPGWVKCRWININGLSWDVVQAIGAHKKLHKLALEDVMELRNRTKVDWFPTHAFIILTLQKIVYLLDSDSDSDSDSNSSAGSYKTSSTRRTVGKTIRRALSLRKRKDRQDDTENDPYPRRNNRNNSNAPADIPPHAYLHSTTMIRTLQQYHASTNTQRTEFMEKHQSLQGRGLAVAAEQVAIFLTSDNTVITFFEASAQDVERPILKRLSTPGTMLRQSCDASLLMQAVIDAIIDLAMPLTTMYNDVLGDIELAVLTDPSITQSKSLYIIISEINKMLSFLNPIDNLVNVLRDHRTSLSAAEVGQRLQDPTSGVIISPMTHTYLGDVLDHCIMITEAMQQIRQSADNLINLIFNTNSAFVNQRMTQLTTITIIFLPLTFITGFFGQNFEPFPDKEKGINYL